jgi:chromosome segregation ATPase
MTNDGLRELQQKKREDSIERVKWAIQYLRDLEGQYCRITAVKLGDISGLSRAALYKPHLRPLWDKKWATIPQKESKIQQDINSFQQDKEKLQIEVALLESKLEKSELEISRLKKKVENEKMRASVYRQDYEELKERHQQLLHHNLRILRKLHLHGVDTRDLNIEDTD